MLQQAESELQRVRARMLEVARPLYLDIFPLRPLPGDGSELEGQNRILTAVLGQIAQRHPTRETYIAETRRDLDEARQFAASTGC